MFFFTDRNVWGANNTIFKREFSGEIQQITFFSPTAAYSGYFDWRGNPHIWLPYHVCNVITNTLVTSVRAYKYWDFPLTSKTFIYSIKKCLISLA